MKSLLFASLILLAGCQAPKDITQAPQKREQPRLVQTADAITQTNIDPFSAPELVKKHPRLQKICDLAGGCDKVKIECTVYDNTGNTVLRNETVWVITALEIDGEGFKTLSKHPIEQAVDSWFEHQKIDAEYNNSIQKEIYPNSKPCDTKTACAE